MPVKKPAGGLRYAVLDRNITLLDEVTSTGFSSSIESQNTSKHVFQAFHTVTTTPSGTVLIEGSLDNSNWVTIGTITLSGSADSEGLDIDADWLWLRARVSAIAGTSATITVLMRS